MKPNKLMVGLVVATFHAATPAHAGGLLVQYLVNAKELKSAVAGTPLTFQIYQDQACTELLQTQVVNADDVDLIEALKTVKVKSDATPPAKTARLQHRIAGLPLPFASQFFAKVSGIGITAVGSECQQVSSAATEESTVGGTLVSSPLDLIGEAGSGTGYSFNCTRDNGYMTNECTCVVTFTPAFVTIPEVSVSGGSVTLVSTTSATIAFTDGDPPLSFTATSVY